MKTHHLPNGLVVPTPTKYWLCSGKATSYSELNAFDACLLNAGVGNTNLVKMSSILPPHCQLIKPVKLPLGALVPVAYAAMTTAKKGQTVAAAVAVAYPEDPDLNGLIMEYHGIGTAKEAEKEVRKMAEEGFKLRDYALRDIASIAADSTCVDQPAAAFAAIVLWN